VSSIPDAVENSQREDHAWQYVARLLEEFGPAYRLTNWLSERTAGCAQKNQAGVTRACGAVMPDLVDLP